jgi:hypothetical protein
MEHPTPIDGTIMFGVAGSRLYGIATANSDWDYLGVAIEPQAAVLGIDGWEHFRYRSRGDDSTPSEAGDTEYTVYGLRKFAKLACHGNPTIVQLFFIPDDLRVVWSDAAQTLVDNFDAFYSRKMGRQFLGYMNAQFERLSGVRGGRHVNRPEYESKHGYDVKYASHAIRLGSQGIELFTTGRLEFPLPNVDLVSAIRRGELTEEQVVTEAARLVARLEELTHDPDSIIPELPDVGRVNDLLASIYLDAWHG